MIWINISIVFLFGALFGFAELLQRYPEAKYIFKVYMSSFYIFLNGVVAVLALFLIKYFKGQNLIEVTFIEIDNLLIAGFGGMMILRSSIFSIKHKEEKIEVGLATLFQIFMNTVEKKMKNRAAVLRIDKIDKIMENVNFDLAREELPILCMSFIDNFTHEDSEKLNEEIKTISNMDIENVNKSLQLGRYIAAYCDEEILSSAINKLPYIKGNTDRTFSNDNIGDDKLHTEDELNNWIAKLKKQ